MTISYSFETSVMTNLNNKKNKEKKSIVDGDKGFSIYFLSKTENDAQFKKIKAMEKGGKVTVSTKMGEGEEKIQDMTEAEFLKMAKADKDLTFAVEYLKSRIRGGVKRTVRKTSKKTTKKVGGRKSSKKTSRKSSRKTSRK